MPQSTSDALVCLPCEATPLRRLLFAISLPELAERIAMTMVSATLAFQVTLVFADPTPLTSLASLATKAAFIVGLLHTALLAFHLGKCANSDSASRSALDRLSHCPVVRDAIRRAQHGGRKLTVVDVYFIEEALRRRVST